MHEKTEVQIRAHIHVKMPNRTEKKQIRARDKIKRKNATGDHNQKQSKNRVEDRDSKPKDEGDT